MKKRYIGERWEVGTEWVKMWLGGEESSCKLERVE